MERLGLVGLPNAGKTSLFNALTGARAPVAPHPYTTTETSLGVASVPDERLGRLAEMSRSRKVVPAGVQVVDIAGLAAGASQGEGLGNRFLAGIREVDALCLVLRAFEDPEVPGESDPVAALEALELELVLADLASVEGQLERRRKQARADKSLQREVAALEEVHEALAAGTPLYRAALDPEGADARRGLFLLTAKPVLAVVNVTEGDPEGAARAEKAVGEALGGAGEVLAVAARLEAEAAELEEAERAELLEGLGLGAGALARVSAAAYRLLGRRVFFTTGEKETRAWSFRAGASAPECAGVIHSDLQRGFIRAEVIPAEELLAIGSWQRAKAEGRVRLEGRDYQVADGDVLEIRFNV
ncbi:redox-regulated ATPase YchF [Aciditerrimonas ferrireducens]|uniref:Redox-regulated ATPase YchF n=1 Tax=Aciditerrimonas ferrireducens TaxID=667306 RepID=A0ABV6C540_9ACTN|nr:redox-regulated ATPase YchF [Aciditerrimonas ferrireducens]MCK4176262.1 redox-regulated ATPase YchF [Aciditerrimonas ferrireducens]